jgi:hypothetical protein
MDHLYAGFDWLTNLIDQLGKPELLNVVIASALASFGGAIGAQIIISRGQTKQAVITELNSIRAAIALCVSITNQFMTLKRQIVRPMRNRYVQVQQEHETFQEAAKAHKGPPPLVFEFQADFQTITPIRTPDKVLEHYAFEKISLPSRGLAAAVSLAGAVDGLERAILYRNEQIAEFQRASPLTSRELVPKYLGLTGPNGVVDVRYKGSVEAIYTQTDDCIFFSYTLADELLQHGKKLRKRYAWRYRLRVRKFQSVDWSIAENAGLIPPKEQYADWLRGFRDPVRRSWWPFRRR